MLLFGNGHGIKWNLLGRRRKFHGEQQLCQVGWRGRPDDTCSKLDTYLLDNFTRRKREPSQINCATKYGDYLDSS